MTPRPNIPWRVDLMVIGLIVICILTKAITADGYKLTSGMIRPTNIVETVIR